MLYPVFETSGERDVRKVFSVTPTRDGKYDIIETDGDGTAVKLCTCEMEEVALRVERAVYEHTEHRLLAMARDDTDIEATSLSDLWEGGLPNWEAQPFLPGECIRCGLSGDVTGYVYKNASGGYTLLGPLCRSCCGSVSEQLRAGSKVR